MPGTSPYVFWLIYFFRMLILTIPTYLNNTTFRWFFILADLTQKQISLLNINKKRVWITRAKTSQKRRSIQPGIRLGLPNRNRLQGADHQRLNQQRTAAVRNKRQGHPG